MRQDIFNYAIDFNGSSSFFRFGKDGINIQSGRPADAIEFRFKLTDADSVSTLPSSEQKQILYGGYNKQNAIRVRWSGSSDETKRMGYIDIINKDNITDGIYITQSVGPASIFDGNWWNFIYKRLSGSNSDNIDQTYELFLKQKDFDGITQAFSASFSLTASSNNIARSQSLYNILRGQETPMVIGSLLTGSVSGTTIFTGHGDALKGQMQEFRLWSTNLNESIFDQHVLSPSSYVGNSSTSSFYDLGFRLRFGTQPLAFNHTIYTLVTSSHPNSDITKWSGSSELLVATASGFENKTNYKNNEEEYIIKQPKILGVHHVDDEIKIDNNDPLIKNENNEVILSRDKSVLKDTSEIMGAASSKIGIYFSPTNEINRDIIDHMGDFKLDDIIGDPAEKYNDEYKELRVFRNEYFKKNKSKYDYIDYLRIIKYYDTSIFKTLKNAFDAKANSVIGTIIEPNILERSKIKTINVEPSFTNNVYSANLQITGSISRSSAEYKTYTSSISSVIIPSSSFYTQYTSSISNFINISSSIYNSTTVGTYTVGALEDTIRLKDTSPISEEGTSTFYNKLNYSNSNLKTGSFTLLSSSRTNGSDYYIKSSYIKDNMIVVSGSRKTSQWQTVKGFFTSSNQDIIKLNHSISLGLYESKSFVDAEYLDPYELGRIRAKWDGTKVTSPDFNRAATNESEGTVNKNGKQDTPDGGPVVEVFKVDPGKLIYKPTSEEGLLSLNQDSVQKGIKKEIKLNPFTIDIKTFKNLLKRKFFGK